MPGAVWTIIFCVLLPLVWLAIESGSDDDGDAL